MSYIYVDAESLVGNKLVDDGKGTLLGQCVSLVKKYSNAPQTTKWKMGMVVRGNKIPKGTAIATFFDGKSYPQKKPFGHAAFYLEQDNDGITVIEQYVGLAKIQKRKIRFKGKSDKKDGVNDGDSYSVID